MNSQLEVWQKDVLSFKFSQCFLYIYGLQYMLNLCQEKCVLGRYMQYVFKNVCFKIVLLICINMNSLLVGMRIFMIPKKAGLFYLRYVTNKYVNIIFNQLQDMTICIGLLKYAFWRYLRTNNLFIVLWLMWLKVYVLKISSLVSKRRNWRLLFTVHDMNSISSQFSFLNCGINWQPSMYIKFSDCVDISHFMFLMSSQFLTVLLGSPVRMLVKPFSTPYKQWQTRTWAKPFQDEQ
jgi:hypothetical protein